MAREPQEFEQHPSPFPGGEFRAHCRHVVDGDTFDVLIDLGFNQYAYAAIRLSGVNTPEIRGHDRAEKDRGLSARERTRELVEGRPVLLRTAPDPATFGRYVAVVRYWREDRWVDLAGTLLEEGHAIPSQP